MADTLYRLIYFVDCQDVQRIGLALKTLLRVTPRSTSLLRTLVSRSCNHTLPYYDLVTELTRSFSDFDTSTYEAVQTYWKQQTHCTSALVGLFYAKAPYEGFVRERILSELNQKPFNFNLSDVGPWGVYISNDSDMVQRLLSVQPESVCICHKLAYTKHILTTVHGRYKEVANFLLSALTNPNTVECCTSHADAVSIIFEQVVGSFGYVDLEPFKHVLNYHPQVVGYVVSAILKVRGFATAFQLLKEMTLDRFTLQSGCVCLFRNQAVVSGVCARDFFTFVLDVVPTQLYRDVVESVGVARLNSTEWIVALSDLQTTHHATNYVVLLQACAQYLTEESKRRFTVTNIVSSLTMVDVELLCDFGWQYIENATGQIPEPTITEVKASCGVWSSVTQCTYDVRLFARVLHRLGKKRLEIPQVVASKISRECFNLCHLYVPNNCVAYLHVIKELTLLTRSTTTVTLELQKGFVDLLAQVPYERLQPDRFVQFCRAWFEVALDMSLYYQRKGILKLVYLLDKVHDDERFPDEILKDSVCKELAKAIRPKEQRTLYETLVFDYNQSHVRVLQKVVIHLLYHSNTSKRRLLKSIVGLRGKYVCKYKVVLMLENLKLLQEDLLFSELLRYPWYRVVWTYFVYEAPETLVGKLLLKMASTTTLYRTLASYVNLLVTKCQSSVLVDVAHLLLRNLTICGGGEDVLNCLLQVLEAIDPTVISRPVSYDLNTFYFLGTKTLHLQSLLLSRLIVIQLTVEMKMLKYLSAVLPQDIVSVVWSFVNFQVKDK